MRSRRYVAVPALVLAALAAQASLASPARAAGPRYASPIGTSAQSCFTPATACNIEKAVNSASAGDEVFIAPGTYNTSTSLASVQSGINVHGYLGQSRPVINSTAAFATNFSGSGTKVSDLTINHNGASYGLDVFATGVTVQRVEVHSTGLVACSPGISGVFRDSLCVTTAAGGFAIDDAFTGGFGFLTIRNVTAIASGSGSVGLRAASNDSTTIFVSARNLIASGTTSDVRASESGTSSNSTVTLQNSNYDVTAAVSGGSVTTAGSGTNQTTPPIFSDTSTYHQALGSPTIDKGETDSSTGTLDIDGDPRPVGLMDIGADEFVPDTTPPNTVFTHVPEAKTRKHKAVFVFSASEPASFACTMDTKAPAPCTSPLKRKLKKTGKHTLSIVAVDAVGNVDPTPATYTWKIKKKKKHHHHRHHQR